MKGEWKRIRLGEVCSKIGSGATPRGGNEVYLEDGPFALIRSQNVYNDGFRREGLAYISEQHAAELDNVEVHEGDVLLNITGDSVARACQVDPVILPARVNQHVAIIRPRGDQLDARFLRYFLVSPETQAKLLSWAAAGATRNALTKAMIESLEVFAPPLPEQRAIAHILGTLDDKIELNRRMSETLEHIAHALFESWFIRFDPVRRNMARKRRGQPSPPAPLPGGEGLWKNSVTKLPSARGRRAADEHVVESSASPLPLGEGLGEGVVESQAFDHLFPARLVDSELGPIPEGWKVGSLACCVRLNPESWSKEDYPGTIAYVDLTNTKWGRIEAVIRYSRTEAPSRAQRVLRLGDTIVGTVRPGNGSYALILEDGLTASTGFAVLRPLAPENREFVYLAATRAENIEALAHLADGGAYPAVRPEAVSSTPVVMPPPALLRRFSQATNGLLNRIGAAERESRTLAALRDALLPKLISGKLRVKDAARFLKESQYES